MLLKISNNNFIYAFPFSYFSAVLAIFDKLIAKTAFPEFNNIQFERNKLDVLRIILGVVIFIRNSQIVDTLYLLQSPKEDVVCGLLHLAIILLFTVGLFTPLATWLLLIVSVSMDLTYGTFTLGTAILCITLLSMALVNPGTNYSLDGFLFKRSAVFKKIVKPLYSSSGATKLKDLRRAYFFAFLLYAVISLGAIMLHIQDEYWTNGLTTKSLLLNSYLCKYYPWFRSIEASFPWVLSALSISAGVLQSIFQFLMIPLIFWKWGRKFIFWWGLNFYLISLVFINLSYLPHIEIILWLLIFVPVGASLPNRLRNSLIGKIHQKIFLKPEGDLKQFEDNQIISKIAYTVYFVGIVLFVAFKFPYVESISKPKQVTKYALTYLRYTGFDLPNVFNRTDLSMGDNWMEMYLVDGERETLCPISGKEGQRLNYAGNDWTLFNNHNSDKLYFGTTLGFRRRINTNPPEKLLKKDEWGWRVMRRRIRYDYLYMKRSGEVTYRIAIMHAPMSEVSHKKWNAEKATNPTKIYEMNVDFDGESISIRSAK